MRLNLPENDLLYAFGRIQSAPTRNVNEMCRKNSLRGDEVTLDYD